MTPGQGLAVHGKPWIEVGFLGIGIPWVGIQQLASHDAYDGHDDAAVPSAVAATLREAWGLAVPELKCLVVG